MKKSIGFLAILAAVALLPGTAEAQRRGRYGNTVNTPFGQFNMNDMAASGGDPYAAEEVREQKMMMQQQQQMLKMQQQYMQQMAKQKKAYDEYIKKHPEAAQAAQPRPVAKAAAKKKKTATTTTTLGATAKAEEKDVNGKDANAAVPGAPKTSTPATKKAK